MLPRIIVYNAVSLDARIDWFPADIGKFYELASHWKEAATLAGSDTIIKAYAGGTATDEEAELSEPSENNPDDTRPVLVVPDSRGRLRVWHKLRREPYWRDVIALCSRATPAPYLEYLKKNHVDYLVAGDEHVDFRVALEHLNIQYGIKVVRVDSGGTLNGVLLRAGLVDEVSVLIHPSLVGGISPQSFFRAPDLTSPDSVIKLELLHLQKLDGDLIWLIYEVVKSQD